MSADEARAGGPPTNVDHLWISGNLENVRLRFLTAVGVQAYPILFLFALMHFLASFAN